MQHLNSFLELKVIWQDDDLIELSVTASNGRFLGTTDVYDTSEFLKNLADSLLGFPNNSDSIFYETGEKNSYAYFSVKFYCINLNGHIGVEVNLESNVATDARPEEQDKLKLELIAEPASVDIFQKKLLRLALNREGAATLYGSKN